MIKQIWSVNRETYEVIINGKEVFYKDRKMPEPIRMIPVDEKIKRRIILSRNKIDPKLIEQFKLTKKEQEEYDNAIQSGGDIEERLAEICKKDCLKIGSVLLKEEHGNND